MSGESELMRRYHSELPKSEKQALLKDYRDIKIGTPEKFFPNNRISTTKYTVYTFFFKNMFEQLSKIANIYFVFLSILQCIPNVTTSNGIPTYLPPLLTIMILTMIKDGYEDYKRYKSDEEENNKKTLAWRDGNFTPIQWRDVMVGDVLKVEKDSFFPADMMIMGSSLYKKGQCFIETKNLDGETNLKSKFVIEDLKNYLQSDQQALSMIGQKINAEGPNHYLSKFKGTLELGQNKFPLSANNFLLRGCMLRNTEYIFGCVVYTGHQTKIMLNSVNARPKKSTLEVMTGYFVILIFIFLCIMCAVCAFVYSIWEYRGDQLVAKYITGVDYNFAYNLLTRLGNWMLVFGTLVPISMLLTLETAKFCQGYIMGIDKGLVDKTGMECEVHSSNLNEELGQVDYIFSDKTGTLTQNEMRFKYLVIGKTAYGEKTGYTGNMPKVSNVDFSDPNAWDAAYQRAQTPEGQKMRKALQLLALCHTIVREKNGSYNASSPDELAFVNVAKLIGCEFLGMDDENYILVNECGQQKRYKLLDVFEFNSDRKRMSVVVQDERGTITLFCKGADSIIAPRYTEQSKPDLKDTMVYVDKFADIGLRTLLLGYKEVSSSEYQTFKSEYDVAKNNLDNRDKEMARVEDKFERGMTIVGATAIEDRLQDQLPETIEFIRNGGVKIWVLTGDKVDTAKNIGFSARLLVKEMEILQYPKDTPDLYQATLKLQDQQDAATQRNIKSSLLVAGDHLETIMSKQNQALFDAFSKLALGCEVVLCCRVTPKQKQEVVAMVKKALPKIVSLAIGDGANDVNMITEAHVGVGIKGVEGQQAARAADFAIGEFRLLKRLMFFHGRESYRKNSNLVLYNFFKNIMLNFPNFWFGWSNYFSGQTAYEELGYQLFNLAFTSLPIGIYALFDRQTSDVVLMKDPKYYRIGPLRLLFNSSRFVRWFIWAIAYSFIVYLIALNFFDLKFSSEDGTVYGFRKTGQVVFVAIIFLTNLKIVSFAHSYSIMLVFLLVISSMLGIFVWIIVSSFDFGTLEHSFSRVIWSSQFWTAIFILIGVAIFDWAVTKLYHYTIMREHYPPGTEEEFLMDVQKAPSDAYVKQTAMQNILERSNTQNFQERMESDDHDEKKSQQSSSEMQTIRH